MSTPHITLVVNRFGTIDTVTINFTLPAGELPAGARATEVSDRIQAIIAANGFESGNIISHHPPPQGWDGIYGD